jgi:hypothetical protein
MDFLGERGMIKTTFKIGLNNTEGFFVGHWPSLGKQNLKQLSHQF